MRGFRQWKWHLDEMYVKLNGEMVYLWRAVDQEGEILESYITKTRNKDAALRFIKKTLKRHGQVETITTDGLRSCKAAMTELGNAEKQEVGRWANNRCENSHLSFRRRERAMLRFRRMKTLQKFASVHANVHNHFNEERHLVDRRPYNTRRSAALAEWQNSYGCGSDRGGIARPVVQSAIARSALPASAGCTFPLPFRYAVGMQALPILYSFRRCPYAMRARMALIASGIAYEHREILLRDKPAAMLAASCKGTVPVLVLANGEVIDESIDIMRWALDQSDPEAWMASADPCLVGEYDGAFKHHLDRYKYAARYGEDPLVHRAAGLAMLSQLDARLCDQSYLGGSTRAFADIAIFPFVRQFAGVDPAWFETAAPYTVRGWLNRLVSSDLFERAMVRHRLWAADEN